MQTVTYNRHAGCRYIATRATVIKRYRRRVLISFDGKLATVSPKKLS